MKMNEEEWDAFASDYYMNQKESDKTIVRDVIEYLKKEAALPTEKIVDVAGGAGRYLAMSKEATTYELIDFSNEMLKFATEEAARLGRENIHLTKQTFSEFLENGKTYDFIFSASNPALDDSVKLSRMLTKMKKYCVILRVVSSKEDLFTSLEKKLGIFEEDAVTSPVIMDQLETYLKDEEWSYKRKEFTYTFKEEITEDFMRAYYQEYLEETIFKEYIQKYFDPKEKIVSTTMLTYRLLLIKKE